jgi:levanase
MRFVIDGDEMVFLAAGGKDTRRLTVALVVEGRTTLCATGDDTLQMRTIRWDLTEHRGKTAYIVITDAASSGWGNISADGFCYTDNPL